MRTEIYCDDCEENTFGIYSEFFFIRDGEDPWQLHLCEKCAAKWNRHIKGTHEQSQYTDSNKIREDDLLTQLSAARDRVREVESILSASRDRVEELEAMLSAARDRINLLSISAPAPPNPETFSRDLE